MYFFLPAMQDAFGAGARVGTKYAYKGGKICAWMKNPDPRPGTIIGMYLIDAHPKGECCRIPCSSSKMDHSL
jgi:hypothetical protein